MKSLISIIFCCIALITNAQESIPELLKRHNNENIPYITVQELAMPKTNAIILDAREKKEFRTSHLKDAFFVGYNSFEIESVILKIPNKASEIVVYCSIGIRSERIVSKLKKAGYLNVFNLYGGIFEWKNNHFPIYNLAGKETDSVHVFSKKWGHWLKNGHKVF